jgi:hypothetical protein
MDQTGLPKGNGPGWQVATRGRSPQFMALASRDHQSAIESGVGRWFRLIRI